jgi:hypothetical protein
MIRNFDELALGLGGIPFGEAFPNPEDPANPKVVQYKLKDFVSRALADEIPGERIDRLVRLKRGELALRIDKGGDLELTPEEVVLIKEVCNTSQVCKIVLLPRVNEILDADGAK